MYAACARAFFPGMVRGSVFGLLTIFYGVGARLSQAITGYLADFIGTLQWSFGLGALTCFVAVLLIEFLEILQGYKLFV